MGIIKGKDLVDKSLKIGKLSPELQDDITGLQSDVATNKGDIATLKTNCSELEENLLNYLPLAGGTVTGDLAVDGVFNYPAVCLYSSDNIDELLDSGLYYWNSTSIPQGTLPDSYTPSTVAFNVYKVATAGVYQVLTHNNRISVRVVTDSSVTDWMSMTNSRDLASYLPLTGGTMTGNINMNGNILRLVSGTGTNINYSDKALNINSAGGTGIKLNSTNTGAGANIELNTVSNNIATYNGEEIATVDDIPKLPANLNGLVPANIALVSGRIYRLATGTTTYGTFSALITAGINNTVRRTIEISAFDYEEGTTGRIVAREVFNPASSVNDITSFTFWYRFNDTGRLELFIKNESDSHDIVAGVSVLQYRAFIPEGFVLEPTSLTTDDLTNIPIRYIEYLSKTNGGEITGTTTYKGSEIATVDNPGSYTLDMDILALNTLSDSSTREEIRELFNIPDGTVDYNFFHNLYNQSAALGKILTFRDTDFGSNNPGGLIPVSFTRIANGNPHEVKFHFSFIPYTTLPNTGSAFMKRVTLRVYSTNTASAEPGMLFEVAVLNHNLGDYFPLSGGKMNGAISMDGRSITFSPSGYTNIAASDKNMYITGEADIHITAQTGTINLNPLIGSATYRGEEIATKNDIPDTSNLVVNGENDSVSIKSAGKIDLHTTSGVSVVMNQMKDYTFGDLGLASSGAFRVSSNDADLELKGGNNVILDGRNIQITKDYNPTPYLNLTTDGSNNAIITGANSINLATTSGGVTATGKTVAITSNTISLSDNAGDNYLSVVNDSVAIRGVCTDVIAAALLNLYADDVKIHGQGHSIRLDTNGLNIVGHNILDLKSTSDLIINGQTLVDITAPHVNITASEVQYKGKSILSTSSSGIISFDLNANGQSALTSNNLTLGSGKTSDNARIIMTDSQIALSGTSAITYINGAGCAINSTGEVYSTSAGSTNITGNGGINLKAPAVDINTSTIDIQADDEITIQGKKVNLKNEALSIDLSGSDTMLFTSREIKATASYFTFPKMSTTIGGFTHVYVSTTAGNMMRITLADFKRALEL